MKFDVIGRINNMRLPDGKTAILYSVYEAVSNSIHAINDRFGETKAASMGKVDVDIVTDEHGDIASISITDNGIGFSQDPISQVFDYIDELRGSKARDIDGGVISDISDQTPFECFIICELTDSTRKMFLKSIAQHPTPDGEGYYGWSTQHNAHINVISFKKMLRDAEQRNQAFFNELDLGSPSLAAKKRSARKREERRNKQPRPIQAAPDGR